MPINIPTRYQRRERLPSALGGARASGAGKAALNQAIVNVGKVVEHRALELKKERDGTIARNAYNEFQEAATQQLYDEESGLLNQKGEGVYNLDDQYTEWFDKFKSDYMAKRFDTDTQARLFEQAVDADRQRDLKSVSKHIMREHERNKVNSITTYMVGAESKVRATPSQADEIIKNTQVEYDKTFPNKDNSVEHAQIALRLRSAQVQEMIDVNAGAALEYLENEQVKKDLGESYHTWKKAEARRLYPGDYNKQEDYIAGLDMDEKAKRSAISTVRGDETEAREREREFRKEGREKLSDAIYKDLREGNHGDALEKVKNADSDFMSEEEKFRFENQINGMTENPATSNDPARDNYWFERIATDPEGFTQADKDALATDRSLKTDRRGKYIKWLDQRLKGDSSTDKNRLAPMVAILEVKKRNGLYLTEDERVEAKDNPELAVENEYRHQTEKLRLVEWAKNNPDKPITEFYGKEQVEEVQKEGWTNKLSNFFGTYVFTTDTAEEIERRRTNLPPEPKSSFSPAGKTVVRTGVHNGRKVVQYSDGSIEYAD
jgi:hypothetical protein